MSSRDTTPKKKSRHKEALEPISMDEILAGSGMSGFVSILDPPEAVPHLQALVDDIKDIPLPTVAEGHWKAHKGRGEAAEGESEANPRRASPNIIHLRRRDEATQRSHGGDPGSEREPGAKRDTGASPHAIPSPSLPRARTAAAENGRFRVRRAVLAQDGHSSGEEVLYQSLWNSRYARPEAKDTRLVTIGWKAMAKLARMTPRNTRRNCQSLIEKLAVEQLSEENSRESIGRTYRLFSYKAILERRRAAGMEWITRSRGVAFVTRPRDAEPGESGRRVEPGTDSAPDAKRGPGPERDPGAKRDTGYDKNAEPSGLLIRTLREYLPDVDDASVAALVEACRAKAADAAEDEIDYFVRIKADLMHRMGTVKSPMGFLKTSVPRCFEGESFRQFRAAEAKRREAAALREAAQEEELRRFLEEQRAVLSDSKSSEEDRRFARHYLGIPEKGTGG
jgi:hypothetical protein